MTPPWMQFALRLRELDVAIGAARFAADHGNAEAPAHLARAEEERTAALLELREAAQFALTNSQKGQ